MDLLGIAVVIDKKDKYINVRECLTNYRTITLDVEKAREGFEVSIRLMRRWDEQQKRKGMA